MSTKKARPKSRSRSGSRSRGETKKQQSDKKICSCQSCLLDRMHCMCKECVEFLRDSRSVWLPVLQNLFQQERLRSETMMPPSPRRSQNQQAVAAAAVPTESPRQDLPFYMTPAQQQVRPTPPLEPETLITGVDFESPRFAQNLNRNSPVMPSTTPGIDIGTICCGAKGTKLYVAKKTSMGSFWAPIGPEEAAMYWTQGPVRILRIFGRRRNRDGQLEFIDIPCYTARRRR